MKDFHGLMSGRKIAGRAYRYVQTCGNIGSISMITCRLVKGEKCVGALPSPPIVSDQPARRTLNIFISVTNISPTSHSCHSCINIDATKESG